MFTFEGNTTEESLAKLRDLTHKYRMSQKGTYRIWLKAGLFMFGFLMMQAGWILIKVLHIIRNVPLSYERLEFGELSFVFSSFW